MTYRHTVSIRPAMHFIGIGSNSGKPASTMQGYEVEFYRSGNFVEFRSYAFTDEFLMGHRIQQWMVTGELHA